MLVFGNLNQQLFSLPLAKKSLEPELRNLDEKEEQDEQLMMKAVDCDEGKSFYPQEDFLLASLRDYRNKFPIKRREARRSRKLSFEVHLFPVVQSRSR